MCSTTWDECLFWLQTHARSRFQGLVFTSPSLSSLQPRATTSCSTLLHPIPARIRLQRPPTTFALPANTTHAPLRHL